MIERGRIYSDVVWVQLEKKEQFLVLLRSHVIGDKYCFEVI